MAYINTPDGPKYFGIYRGTVLQTDEKEPQNEVAGRLKIRVPLIHGPNVKAEDLPWAYPIFPSTCPQGGFVDIPEVNSWVLVCCEDGDPNALVYLGGWFPANRFPYKAKYSQGFDYPKIKMWRTSQGQMVRMVTGKSVEIFAGNNDYVYKGNEPINEKKDGILGGLLARIKQAYDNFISLMRREPKPGEVLKGDHREWDTYIKMDLIQRRLTIRSKYPIDIRSSGKVKVKGVDVDVIAAVEADMSGNPMANIQGTDVNGVPVYTNHRGSKLVLRCIDNTGKTAASLGLGPAKTGIQEVVDDKGKSSFFPITVSSSIEMTPSRVVCKARKVRGFKDR